MDDIRDRFRASSAPSGGRRDFLGPMQPPRPAAQRPQPAPKPQATPSSWMHPSANRPPSTPKQKPQPQPKPIQPRPQTRAAQPRPQQGPIPQRPAAALPKKRRAKKGKKKPVLAVLALLVLLLGGGGAYAYFGRTASDEQASQTPTADTAGAVTAAEEPQLQQGTIKLIATGTFAAYDSVHINAKSGDTYDYLPLMNKIKPAFDGADIRICHQQTIAGGADKGITGYPEFNAPFEWSEAMVGLGCNVMNMASRNTNDKGQEAIAAAVKFFDDQESMLAVAGANRTQAEQDKIRYFEVKGLKFAFLSYTTQSQKPPAQKYGVNMWNEQLAAKQITEAKKNADFIIVGMAWGDADKAEVTPEQNKIAAFLAKQDADLIIGNGSHILQPAKVLDGTNGHQTLVWFSLGNAVNSQLPMENLVGGIAVVEIDIQSQDMLNPGLLPVYQHYEWTAAQKASSNFDARKNLSLYMLDQAAEALAKSQNNTTVEAQTKRVKGIITSEAPIKLLTSKDLE